MKLKDIRGLELPIEYSKIILEPAIKIDENDVETVLGQRITLYFPKDRLSELTNILNDIRILERGDCTEF